ncbi:hypothetical protein ACQ4PT_048170 [Festuca glaucescens]
MDFALDAHPSEQELIVSHLSPRVVSGDKSSKFIHEGDVYAAHPADLTRDYAAAVSSNGDEAWYFFTAVRARGGGRRSRTVDSGEGCWHSEAGSKPVDSAHHGGVGYRQTFSFVTKVDGARVRSGWLMAELGLREDGQDEMTLCKVYFSPRAAAKNHRNPAAAASCARKRKAGASVTAHQCHRRASHKTSKEDHAKAGKQEGLVEVEERSPSPADEPEVEDRDDFFWWLRNKDKVREEIGISKEDFYRHTAPSVWEWAMDYCRHTAAPKPVVRSEDEKPFFMWLTLDELYDLPEIREFLSPAKLLEEMRGSSAKNEQISR